MPPWILTTIQQSVNKHHQDRCHCVTPNRLLSHTVIQLRQVQLPPVNHRQWGTGKSFASDVCLENEPAAESCVGGGAPFTAPPAEGDHTSRSSDPGAEAQQNQEVSWLRDKAEQVKDPNKDVTPAVASGTTACLVFFFFIYISEHQQGGELQEMDCFLICHSLSISVLNLHRSILLNVSFFVVFLPAKKAAIESKSNAQRGKEEVNTASPTNDNSPLPPFNPHNPVGKIGFIHMIGSVVFSSQPVFALLFFPFFSLSTGMEFLAPKTGFFCKVCNRFFSGAKEAEIAHCKTRKHYDNVRVSTMHICNVGTQI